jgi:hypothetical protein
MPEATSTQAQAHATASAPRLTLNTDGQRHPLLNVVTVFVCLAGIAAFAISLVVHLHVVATCLGIVTFGVGLWAQMVSATREERILIVTGLVGAFVGMGLGLAHGGF